ncbi:hypothetical protein [Microbacterium maritypicum]
MNTVPKVPTDETSLSLILEAMETASECDEDGNVSLVGGTITISQLLDFWSGYDKSKEQYVSEGVSYYPHPVLMRDDIIRALIEEIRTLRANVNA